MKVKKLILMSVVALLVVALTAGTALAGNPGKGNDNKSKGSKGDKVQVRVEKQVKHFDFSDVSPNHWACKRIKAMAKKGIVKGYGNGKFHPNASVSNIEALTMIVRFSQEVDADDLKDALKDSKYYKDAKYYKGVPLWARGYIAIALEEEILTEDDLDDFRPNAAAKRAFVAVLLGRAMDVDPDDDYRGLDFKDLKQIPKEALEYLPYLVEEGYITGYHNGKFMPNKPVTRAELANILAKIDADIDDDDEDIDIDVFDKFKAVGKIFEIDENYLVLKIKGTKKEFSVDDDVIVFLDNKDADIEDLEEGYRAVVFYDKNKNDNEALLIYACSDNDD